MCCAGEVRLDVSSAEDCRMDRRTEDAGQGCFYSTYIDSGRRTKIVRAKERSVVTHSIITSNG